MLIAHHLIWTCYGWWLPNDPRGSGSCIVRGDLIAELGDLHFGRKRVQPPGHEVRAFYDAAAGRLKHPLMTFEPADLTRVGTMFGDAIRACGYTCYAMAAMPYHVHLIVRKHRDRGEVMIERLQTLTRDAAVVAGLRPPAHPVWTRGGWKVFLESPDDIRRTIRYIEQNPVKGGLPVQVYGWVTPYDGWPLHKGR